MNNLKYIFCLIFSLLIIPCWATIDIGIREHDPGSIPHEVIISYTANANYNSNPENLWNSHFIIVRYPNSLPNAGSLVSNVINTAGFSFSAVHLGDDGTYKYMALDNPATNVVFNINNNEAKDILTIQFNAQSQNATFELMLSTSVLGPPLNTSVNNSSLGDVFSGIFDPALASNVQLPVELLKFNASPVEKYIHLNWTSASEINFSGYELQRSADGRLFQEIAWINGKGGHQENHYFFEDKSVTAGTRYFYRMKMMDLDGSFAYSGVRSAELERDDRKPLIVPNPTKNTATINFIASREGLAKLIVFNGLGKLFMEREIALVEGENIVEIEMGHLPSGVYSLQLREAGVNSWQEKIVKN